MLKPYIQSDRLEQTISKVRLPDGTEGELVEDIVGFRRRKGKPEYHVKWLGQSRLTWEPLENLQYVPDLVRNFHERQTYEVVRQPFEGGHVRDVNLMSATTHDYSSSAQASP
ncbi:unnamed protein product [Phytophthora lilii]|uniref:Unnamed protein product n=1 Tax=Phytophthora lilii TaxID=2077276 RepID=A0A9W7CYN9_9STRA|nr:unnamed protein product [Phytophthora lilii]